MLRRSTARACTYAHTCATQQPTTVQKVGLASCPSLHCMALKSVLHGEQVSRHGNGIRKPAWLCMVSVRKCSGSEFMMSAITSFVGWCPGVPKPDLFIYPRRCISHDSMAQLFERPRRG